MQLVSKWSYLKRARTSGIAKLYPFLLIAVPLFASTSVGLEHYFLIRFPAPVNFIFLYFSALLFTLSSLVFDQFCPKAIAEYDGRFRFTEDWIAHQEIVTKRLTELDGAIGRLVESVTASISADVAGLDEEKKREIISRAVAKIHESLFDRDAISSLDKLWQDEDTNRLLARTVVQSLYVLSALLTLYITFIDAPMRVFQYLF